MLSIFLIAITILIKLITHYITEVKKKKKFSIIKIPFIILAEYYHPYIF